MQSTHLTVSKGYREWWRWRATPGIKSMYRTPRRASGRCVLHTPARRNIAPRLTRLRRQATPDPPSPSVQAAGLETAASAPACAAPAAGSDQRPCSRATTGEARPPPHARGPARVGAQVRARTYWYAREAADARTPFDPPGPPDKIIPNGHFGLLEFGAIWRILMIGRENSPVCAPNCPETPRARRRSRVRECRVRGEQRGYTGSLGEAWRTRKVILARPDSTVECRGSQCDGQSAVWLPTRALAAARATGVPQQQPASPVHRLCRLTAAGLSVSPLQRLPAVGQPSPPSGPTVPPLLGLSLPLKQWLLPPTPSVKDNAKCHQRYDPPTGPPSQPLSGRRPKYQPVWYHQVANPVPGSPRSHRSARRWTRDCADGTTWFATRGCIRLGNLGLHRYLQDGMLRLYKISLRA